MPVFSNGDGPAVEGNLRATTWRLWLGLALGLPLLAYPVGTVTGIGNWMALQATLCTPVVLVCGWPFLVRAWQSARALQPNMAILIGLGIGAAYAYSLFVVASAWWGAASPTPRDGPSAAWPHGTIEPYFESATGIVTLVLLGQVLELRAHRRTGEAVRKLIHLAPKTARVVRPGGQEEDVPLDLVQVGDIIRVRPAERIPVDGVVIEGTTHVDESMLTGEPTRVGKGPGMKVMAGTENGLGTVKVRALQVAGGTLLAQIIALVGKAQRARGPLQRTVDRIAMWFVPLVLLAAAGTFATWYLLGPPESALPYATACSVGVLIVACPCALGLATPAAVVAGMSRAARSGVLFRDAAAFERLSAVDAIVLDKTGTLTEGRPRLMGVQPNVGVSVDDVLALAAAVERGSEHPLGLAIVWEAAKRNLPIPAAEAVEAVPGRGIRGVVGEHRVTVGRLGFLQESGVHHDLMVSEANTHRLHGHGVTFVGRGARCVGLIVTNDPIRSSSREAVERLRAAGLRLILVTGDHVETAKSVAGALAIEEVVADTLPAEKYAMVQRLKNEGWVVAVCGEGVNDAPALAAADVGVAMGTGTDVAINVAGVTLTRPDLRAVEAARELSRQMVRTIHQNATIALAYSALAIPIAAGILVPFGGRVVSPVWALAVMCLSSLSVGVNTIRAHLFNRKIKPPRKLNQSPS